jgi:hypothetical protein
MRSIRARGRTHSWVVVAFLLREKERAERGRAREKRQHLLKESTHPKANRNTDFEAADNKEVQDV